MKIFLFCFLGDLFWRLAIKYASFTEKYFKKALTNIYKTNIIDAMPVFWGAICVPKKTELQDFIISGGVRK